MNNNIFLRKIAGIVLIILGVIGLFLPFLQGILFLALGSTLLGSPWISRQVARLRCYFKK